MLEQASVFITHGGGNSVRQSITLGVPMLVFPTWLDTQGTAARVEGAGVGLRASMKSETADALKAKLVRLVTDPVIQERVRFFKDAFGRPGLLSDAAARLAHWARPPAPSPAFAVPGESVATRVETKGG